MNDNKQTLTVVNDTDELMSFDYDNIMQVAVRADRMVTALNKIMSAALKVTTPKDWTIIGGSPYLQESGATKVARLFGIGWRIADGQPTVERDSDGYPTYTYRMTFTMGNITIEAEGSRSARDEFFAGKKTDKDGNPKKQKSIDEIDMRDVKQAAYTNCLNNGIKRILPGLRNLEVSDLEKAGLNTSALKGYTFKTGSRGGNSGKAEDSGILCEDCGKPITQKVASYSESKYGRKLCMDCQKAASMNAIPAQYDAPPAYGYGDDDAPPERR